MALWEGPLKNEKKKNAHISLLDSLKCFMIFEDEQKFISSKLTLKETYRLAPLWTLLPLISPDSPFSDTISLGGVLDCAESISKLYFEQSCSKLFRI